MTKYIFVTGGVVSSLGKGIAAASLGTLLESRGLKVSLLKLDPYINVDPGTMSPYQHGEVYVTDDGADPDSDELSNYWEFAWDTDPFTADSDQDGMPDGWEHYYSEKNDQCGLDPSDFSDQHADPDNDGSDNLREYNENTDPCDDDSDDDGDGWLDVDELICANLGGLGDPRVASEMPADSDWIPGPDGEMGTSDDIEQGDGICDAKDKDDDGDGYPDPANPNNPTGDEDRYPNDHTEWFDANNDGQGDNAVPTTLIDNINADPAPYVGILVVVGAMGYGLVQMSRRAGGEAEYEGEDYTEEFEEFDFEDEEADDSDSDDEDDEED